MATLMRQISVTYRCAMQYRERELADTGLCGSQPPYILALYRRPGLTQEELAKELDVNKSSVTRQLASLEEKGYIYRMSDDCDRRMLRVYPTEKALELRERLGCVLGSWSDFLMSDFTDEEKELLNSMMIRISQKAEEYVHTLAEHPKGGDKPCERSCNI